MSDGWTPAAALRYPTMCTYLVTGPAGFYAQSIGFNIDRDNLDPNIALQMMVLVWKLAIAPLLVGSMSLFTVSAAHPENPLGGTPHPVSDVAGTQDGAGCPVEDCPCVMLHTGHQDPAARYRLWLPGFPVRWTARGKVTAEGLGHIQTYMRALILGCSARELPGEMTMLRYHPGYGLDQQREPKVWSYRRYQYIRIYENLGKAPGSLNP